MVKSNKLQVIKLRVASYKVKSWKFIKLQVESL
jgi:hypothetical protein